MCHSLSPSARWSCHSMASSGTTFPDNCAYTDFRATRWRQVYDLPATRWQRVAHAGDNARVYTNWLEWPLGAILGHLCTLLGCCAVVDRREDAIVYTNRRKWPIGAVLGHLCTLLGCCAVVDRRGDAIVYTNGRIGPLRAVLGRLCTLLRHESQYESRRELRQVARAPQPPRRAGGAPSLAPLAWSGRQALSERRRCQVGIFAEASTHTNP